MQVEKLIARKREPKRGENEWMEGAWKKKLHKILAY
jgi:hypothetical protein